jgi:hypothetical protein
MVRRRSARVPQYSASDCSEERLTTNLLTFNSVLFLGPHFSALLRSLADVAKLFPMAGNNGEMRAERS